ncbi:lipopolysaccharide assembly protein LapA domain-containing protein [Levilactobacillus zymae]|uniref:LapA family protein n=1 Tax=Levilactobacillus zymae TaxID=267363 RepID=UPI0028BA097C|nr:lipopolysaccharide assembly protein LapA domain-containing protein [Levilactobacillus zymae]MDT6980430.1 lipopolysaccharide assembly protein LapA domain-containing protein [Levilactobacillus zymae]
MKNQWRIIVTILLVIVVAVFAILNVESVPVSFGFTTVHWPLILLLLVSILIGAILVILFSTITSLQHNRAYKELEKTSQARIAALTDDNQRLQKRLKNSGKQAAGQQDKQIQDLEAQVKALQAQLAAK